VPTPALVAPIEFTLKLDDYSALGGYVDRVRPLSALLNDEGRRHVSALAENPWPLEGKGNSGKKKRAQS
jgi:hypothetical protein